MQQEVPALEPETIRALVRLVEENALTELTIEEEGFAISLKAGGAVHGLVPASMLAPADESEQPAAVDGKRRQIRAPMTGVFYRAAAPGEPPFVEPGDAVEVGQIIGLIEAMKVFSEVPADAAGTVVEIPAKNGELVQQDQVLVILAVEEEDAGE